MHKFKYGNLGDLLKNLINEYYGNLHFYLKHDKLFHWTVIVISSRPSFRELECTRLIRKYAIATNSDFLIPIYLHLNVVDL